MNKGTKEVFGNFFFKATKSENSNGIIYHSQSVNRKLHSTETVLLHYTDELLKNMDYRKISVIVLLDMSKAFDSIRHDLLINELYKEI